MLNFSWLTICIGYGSKKWQFIFQHGCRKTWDKSFVSSSCIHAKNMFYTEKLTWKVYLHHSSVRWMFRQIFLGMPLICKFWNVFICRITGYTQKNPHLLLTFSDFFKLLFESYIGDLPKIKSLLLLFGQFWAVPQLTFV